jgi:23S rRNA (cytosine1962-C5)-methyltransferase
MGYQLLDVSGGERLEKWGNLVLIRPDPRSIWQTQKNLMEWQNPDARHTRTSTGGGIWQFYTKKNPEQVLEYGNLRFLVKPTNFKHMGLFPEQESNWKRLESAIKASARPVRVLNLFGYTGAASLVAAGAGAAVCHVDAAKGMINWGKVNQRLSGQGNLPIRWIVDDCVEFVKRELRRGSKYDIVILDPPAYGNGKGGKRWKLEEDIYTFLELLSGLLSNKFLMLILNMYTPGFCGGVVRYLLQTTIGTKFKSRIMVDEIGLRVNSSELTLPCGFVGIAVNHEQPH